MSRDCRDKCDNSQIDDTKYILPDWLEHSDEQEFFINEDNLLATREKPLGIAENLKFEE